MMFNSPGKWWGDLGQRDFPHEGIDFCFYRDDSGRIVRLDQKTRLPAMHNGIVRSMFTDYLGQAVIIEHDDAPSQDGTLVSISTVRPAWLRRLKQSGYSGTVFKPR